LGPQATPCARDPGTHGGLGTQDPFRCIPQLPSVSIPARTIEALEPGTILRLDLPATTMPIWRVAGQTLSKAQAIRQGARRAARIDQRMDEAEA